MRPLRRPMLVRPLWTPERLGAAIKLWYDAQAPSTMTLAGANITTWANKAGGGGYALTHPSDPALTYNANAGGSGKPGIVCTGATGWTGTSDVGLPTATSGITFFGVIRGDPSPPALGGLLYYGTASAGQNRYFGTSTSNFYAGVQGTDMTSAGYSLNSTSRIVTAQLAINANQGLMHVDGNSAVTTTLGIGAAVLTGSMQAGLLNGGSPFKGVIHEMGMVIGPLVAADRQKLEGYAAYRWGLQGQLPAGHPYKFSPP